MSPVDRAQGFVLGQYGLLYAQQHDESINKLVILNTPVDVKSALRPELAAYKNPIAFLRPKADKRFDAMTYNASGLAYVRACVRCAMCVRAMCDVRATCDTRYA